MLEKNLQFTLAGNTFSGSHLSPEKSLECLALLAPAFASILDNLDAKELQEAPDGLSLVANALQGALLQFDALPKAAKYFEPCYDVLLDHEGASVPLPLATQKDRVFGGKGLLYAGFLIGAITKEYLAFLQEGGLNMLQDLGALYGFKMTLPKTGKSGE